MSIAVHHISIQEDLLEALINYRHNEFFIIDVTLVATLGVPLLYATITNNTNFTHIPHNIIVNVNSNLSYLIALIDLSFPFIIYYPNNSYIFSPGKLIAHHKNSTIIQNENFLFEYFINKV